MEMRGNSASELPEILHFLLRMGSSGFHMVPCNTRVSTMLWPTRKFEYSQRTGSYPPWNRKHTIPATKRLGVTPSIMTTLFKRNRHIFWLLVSRPIPIPKVTVWVNLDHHTVSPNMIEIWLKHDTVWLKIDHQILVSAKSYMFETTKQSHFPNWISGSFPSWPTGAEFLWCLVQLQGNSHVQLWPQCKIAAVAKDKYPFLDESPLKHNQLQWLGSMQPISNG